MYNNFKPPSTGFKQINPMTNERQMMGMKHITAPGAGPLTLPSTRPQFNLNPPQMHPLQFQRLRAMFAQGR